MGSTLKDLRFAIRQLRKSPGFAFTAVMVFALGIGAATAIFAFVDAAFIKPLPIVTRRGWSRSSNAIPLQTIPMMWAACAWNDLMNRHDIAMTRRHAAVLELFGWN